MGVRTGAENFIFADASNQAMITVSKLKALRAEEPEIVIFSSELELTSLFYYHDQYLDSPWKWLFSDITANSELNMKYAVKYRLEHPYEMPVNENIEKSEKNELSKVDKAAKRMLEKYK